MGFWASHAHGIWMQKDEMQRDEMQRDEMQRDEM